jgi:hypothetical protein
MFKKHDAEITGVAKVTKRGVWSALDRGGLVMKEGRTSIVNAAMNKAAKQWIVSIL